MIRLLPSEKGNTMNKMKKRSALALCAMLICCCLILGACGEQASGGSTEANYKITVLDPQGNAMESGVIVRILKDGEQVAMQVANGGVVEKTMEKADYTVELMFTDSNASYYYDQAAMTLSASKTELEVKLLQSATGEGQSINGYSAVDGSAKAFTAYQVGQGSTYVTLSAEDRSYFLFTPTEAGTYQFSLEGSSAAIGYYGAPHFVQKISVVEVENNIFTVSVSASMIGTGNTGTSSYVIGIDPAQEGTAVLKVERIGDPEYSVADEPWTVYKTTATISAFTLPEGAKLVDFDLTAASDAYTLVYNETDGYYHLNTADGPLVLVRLGKNAGTKYIDPLGRQIESSNVVKYFYDDAGNFVKKESYTQCLYEYCAGTDSNQDGVIESYYYLDKSTDTYPLTEDLKYIIQQRGEYACWWDASSIHYLFKETSGAIVPDINPDIAWLFMCCYIAE